MQRPASGQVFVCAGGKDGFFFYQPSDFLGSWARRGDGKKIDIYGVRVARGVFVFAFFSFLVC